MITIAAKNNMLATLAITRVSLHTADPGADGTTAEIDVPRGVVAFGSPSDGRIALVSDVTMLISDPVTITHLGYWDDATFVLSQEFAPQEIIEPSNFTLQATTTYIEI